MDSIEEEYFNRIRDSFCRAHQGVDKGKMMTSEAMNYKGKVFAFFSRNEKMVFKLGKDYDPSAIGDEVVVFNPFKKRPPLNGWYEVPYTLKEHWEPLAGEALRLIKQNR